jgi:hypothetical protein
MQMWYSPIPNLQKIFTWVSDYLSEVWLFSMAVFLLWHPAFPERLQNGICIAGLMSVSTALVRLKKIEHKIDEMRATQLLREGRTQAWLKEKFDHNEELDRFTTGIGNQAE